MKNFAAHGLSSDPRAQARWAGPGWLASRPNIAVGPCTEARVKSSRRQENSATILVPGELKPIYLDGSLKFRAPLHQISPKI